MDEDEKEKFIMEMVKKGLVFAAFSGGHYFGKTPPPASYQPHT